MSETQEGSFSWVRTKMGFNSDSMHWHIAQGLVPMNFDQNNRNSRSYREIQPKLSKSSN